jgi:hypothetical protein
MRTRIVSSNADADRTMTASETMRMHWAIQLAKDVEVCASLLRGELVDLANAEALSDAAEHELYVRGVKKSDPNYEALYVCEIESLARESGVFYDQRS